MIFNRHSELKDKHAFLSASKYSWLNYDDEKMADVFSKSMASALGTRKHAVAVELIEMGIKLPNTNQTLNMYVNDCIGYRMETEVTLFYSYNAFGTADAIKYINGESTLRIFDLKTGTSPAKDTQLKVYAALFCLEYKVPPANLIYDLRIYQNDDIAFSETDAEEIMYIMARIKESDALIENMKKEVL